MRHNESKLQIACVNWFRYQYPKKLLFSIPNGGKRLATEAKTMRAEGVLSGVSDLFLAFPCSGYSGLFIEMKFGKGKMTDNQKRFSNNASSSGYLVACCRTFEEFVKTIEMYFTGKIDLNYQTFNY